MNKNILKTDSGLKISFTGNVEKQNIVKMVENCSAGKCDCMDKTTKNKITDMQVSGKDGNIELSLSGDISSEEIKNALLKSKFLK